MYIHIPLQRESQINQSFQLKLLLPADLLLYWQGISFSRSLAVTDILFLIVLVGDESE